MMGVSEMKLTNYKVIKTFFELNESFEFKPGKTNIQPKFDRIIDKIDEAHYNIKLSVKVSQSENKNPIPFNAEVVILSTFELPNWESLPAHEIAITNATR